MIRRHITELLTVSPNNPQMNKARQSGANGAFHISVVFHLYADVPNANLVLCIISAIFSCNTCKENVHTFRPKDLHLLKESLYLPATLLLCFFCDTFIRSVIICLILRIYSVNEGTINLFRTVTPSQLPTVRYRHTNTMATDITYAKMNRIPILKNVIPLCC
jgi:hypothetical protein